MALNIKDPETDRLARELADATGESITVAVRTAIKQRLTRECDSVRDSKLKSLEAIVARVASLPRKHPERSSKELMDELYDENGLPK